MVKRVLLSLCVFSSIGLAQDFSSIFLLKPLEIIGSSKGFEAFKSSKTLQRKAVWI